jgi:hypothetical protein
MATYEGSQGKAALEKNMGGVCYEYVGGYGLRNGTTQGKLFIGPHVPPATSSPAHFRPNA